MAVSHPPTFKDIYRESRNNKVIEYSKKTPVKFFNNGIERAEECFKYLTEFFGYKLCTLNGNGEILYDSDSLSIGVYFPFFISVETFCLTQFKEISNISPCDPNLLLKEYFRGDDLQDNYRDVINNLYDELMSFVSE